MREIPPIILVILGSFVMVPILTFYAFSTRNPFIPLGMALIPFMILMVNNLQLWFIVAILSFSSQIRLPIAGNLEVFNLLAFGLFVILLLRIIIVKQLPEQGKQIRFFIVLLGLVIVATMYARGAGFRALGSNLVGGMRYVGMLVPMLLLLVSTTITLRRAHWVFLVFAVCMMPMIPLLAEVLFIESGGRFYHMYYLVQAGSGVAQSYWAHELGMDLVRYKSGSDAGRSLCLLGAFIFLAWRRHRLAGGGLVALGLVIAAISGHRQALLGLIIFFFTLGFLVRKQGRLGYVALSAVMLGLALLATALVAQYLPHSIQRAVSWVPGAQVSPEVEMSAAGTTDWRIRVWKEGWREIPQYFWLGKGYAYSQDAVHSLQYLPWGQRNIQWAVVTVGYHNGPLSFLIGLGIIGALAATGLFTAIFIDHYRATRRKWNHPRLQCLHLTWYAMFTAQFVSVMLITGNVPTALPGFLFLTIIMQGITTTDAEEVLVKEEDPDLLDAQDRRSAPSLSGSLFAGSGA